MLARRFAVRERLGTRSDRCDRQFHAGRAAPSVRRPIDLTVTTAAGDREYTITPALIDAVGRRETNADIDTYIDRHGVAGLATTLTYAVAREHGEVAHRLMAEDLDSSPLAAEMILQALRPVVHEHHDIKASGASLDELDIDDAIDDA